MQGDQKFAINVAEIFASDYKTVFYEIKNWHIHFQFFTKKEGEHVQIKKVHSGWFGCAHV